MPDINRAYTWAVNTCDAPKVGYSQKYRNQQTVNGITYYDCSSFINYALLAGGWTTPSYAPNNNAFTTATERSALTALGFTEVDPKGVHLAGDIGWVDGHTEMCYKGGDGEGIYMGAHSSKYALAKQVSISDYYRTWTRLFRYGNGGAVGTGSSIYVISALAGNAWRESHINPTLQQLGGSGFGLFQMDGERKQYMLTYLSENGYVSTDPIGQMSYFIWESENRPQDAWIGTYAGISSLKEFLNSSSTDVRSLTEAYCYCSERPGIPAIEERVDFAQKALTYIQQYANDTSIIEWYTEPMYYLSESQALHNAVLMYRFFSGGGGGGGTFTPQDKGMPLWMKIRYY